MSLIKSVITFKNTIYLNWALCRSCNIGVTLSLKDIHAHFLYMTFGHLIPRA